MATMFSKLIGLAKEFAVAYAYGTTAFSDAYVIGTTVSTVIITGIAGSLLVSFIPVGAKIYSSSEIAFSKYTSNIMNFFSLSLLALCVLLTIFAEDIIRLLSALDDPKILAISTAICRLTTIPSIFLAVINIAVSHLHIKNHFEATAIQSFSMSAVLIATVLIARENYVLLGIGYALSMVVPGVLLLLYCGRFGYRYSFELSLSDANLKEALLLSLPVFLGEMIGHFSMLVERSFASAMETGAVSSLRYARLLLSLITQAIALPVSQVAFPQFSRMAGEPDGMGKVNGLLQKSAQLILFLLMPVIAMVSVLSPSIIRLLFMRGAFDETAVEITASIFSTLVIAALPIAFNELLSRMFYSLKSTLLPVLMHAAGCAAALVLYTPLMGVFGFRGIAAATLLGESIFMLLLFILLRRRIHLLPFATVLADIVKCGACALVMGFLAFALRAAFTGLFMQGAFMLPIALLIVAVPCAVVYISMAWLLRVEISRTLVSFILKKTSALFSHKQ